MSTQLTDINDIVTLLVEADEAYHNGVESNLTDSEYDSLKKTAFSIAPDNAYFKKVGSDSRTGKIKLPYTMGSLDQLYTTGEVLEWLRKLGAKQLLLSDKLDGISVMLVYNDRNLSIAYSRGNGVEGADITRHVLGMSGVPKQLAQTAPNYLVVRCEAIMPVDTFKERHAATFKNPRNMVAGCANRKTTEAEVLADIDLIAYELVSTTSSGSQTEDLQTLQALGFKTVHYSVLVVSQNIDVEKYMQERMANSLYELDGIVITSVDKTLSYGKQSDDLNPEHSVKYKPAADSNSVEATVVDVIYDLSKGAAFKPRVQIAPVELSGVTIKYATGFNVKFISDNGIGKGAKIKIVRSGAVIPYIVEVVSKVQPKLPDTSMGEWKMNETGVDAVLIDGDSNPYVIFKQVLDFFETLEIDQLKSASLQSVIEYLCGDIKNIKNYDDMIATIYDLSEFEWTDALGANGSKIYSSLLRRSAAMKPETFLGAVKHMGFGFGVRKAKKLLSAIQDQANLHLLSKLNESDVRDIDGFDETAVSTIRGIEPTLDLFDRLSHHITIKAQTVTAQLSGLSVVFTGFRDAELQNKVEGMGGKVGSGVSKKTTHVISAGDKTSSKYQKAMELGIPVLTVEQFKDAYSL